MTRGAVAVALAAWLAGSGLAEPYFRDATRAAGVRFRHRHGGFLMNLPETTGAGVAVLDYDGDGLEDLFFVQGAGAGGEVPVCQLYRNLGSMRFAEVALPAGVARRGAGMGCLAADLDGDGDADLAVVGYGEPWSLYVNQGDGTFADRARALGAAGDGRFASFVTALDHDRDGRLDLYVGRYVAFDARHEVRHRDGAGIRSFAMGALARGMAVHAHGPADKTLLHNELPAGFCDVTRAANAGDAHGRGLGAVGADLDGDGWADLFVANDQSACTFLRNRGDGTFEDASRAAWVDEVRGSMGIALGDVQDDGRLDVLVTHWWGDAPALYENLGRYRGADTVRFVDRGDLAGLASARAGEVGWGVAFVDVDRDGREDVLAANGHTHYRADRPGALAPQRAALWRRTGMTRFERVTPARHGDPLALARVGRGLAVGDLDRDGARDVVVTANNGPAEVWRGTPPRDTAWVGLELVGTRGLRDGIGARLTLATAAGPRTRELCCGEGYLSSSSRVQVFGLGGARGPLSAAVRWPSGARERFAGLAPMRYHRLIEGAGVPATTEVSE